MGPQVSSFPMHAASERPPLGPVTPLQILLKMETDDLYTILECIRNSHISCEVSWHPPSLLRRTCLCLCLHCSCSAISWHFLFRPDGIKTLIYNKNYSVSPSYTTWRSRYKRPVKPKRNTRWPFFCNQRTRINMAWRDDCTNRRREECQPNLEKPRNQA